MRKTNWFWGSIFIMAAALLIATQMGWLSLQMPVVTIIIAIILVALLVSNLIYRSIGGSIFALAVLAMLFSRQLGIQALMPWTIIGVSLLLIIGLKLIFRPKSHWSHSHYDWTKNQNSYYGQNHHRPYENFNHMNFGQPGSTDDPTSDDNRTEFNSNDQSNPSIITITTTMQNNIRYLQGSNLETINLRNYMGDTKVYFDQLTDTDHLELNIDNSLGSVNLYLPQNWQVTNELNLFLSASDERGMHSQTIGPRITIRGRIYLGNLVIHYI